MSRLAARAGRHTGVCRKAAVPRRQRPPRRRGQPQPAELSESGGHPAGARRNADDDQRGQPRLPGESVRSGGRIDGRRGRVDPPALHEWQQQRRAEDAVPRAQAQARIGHAQEREYRAGHGNQQERLERPASEVADDERQAHDAPPFLRIARRSSSRSFLVTCLFSIRCSISGLAEPPNMRSRNSFTIARITACRLLADS